MCHNRSHQARWRRQSGESHPLPLGAPDPFCSPQRFRRFQEASHLQASSRGLVPWPFLRPPRVYRQSLVASLGESWDAASMTVDKPSAPVALNDDGG